MAKVKFKGLESLEGKLKKRLNEALKNQAMLTDVGERIVRDIQGQARQGKEVESRSGFTSLKKNTVKQRKELAKTNQTGQFYRPNRPMNFTGQLLNSIYFKISNTKPLISIDAKGDHKPYKNKQGKTTGKAISNRELLKIHQEGLGNNPSRKVLGVSEKMIETIRIRIKSHLRKLLKK